VAVTEPHVNPGAWSQRHAMRIGGQNEKTVQAWRTRDGVGSADRNESRGGVQGSGGAKIEKVSRWFVDAGAGDDETSASAIEFVRRKKDAITVHFL
jgi:hypothetical protein